jgi:hypothetical protein
LNRFEKHLAENVRITAPRRELLSFSKKRGPLILDVTQASEVIHDLGAHRRSFSERLRCLQERVQKNTHGLPMPQRLLRIVEPHPPMPLGRFPSLARTLPMVGEECRALAELFRL